jgi:hypothetical protein
VFEFQGQSDYSFAEVATEIGKGIERAVEHVAASFEAAIEAMTGMGLQISQSARESFPLAVS